MDIKSVKAKIAKLLALADSPNENEAKQALLKARSLMAEYKLREAECRDVDNEDVKVCVETIGVYCTKMTDAWAVTLAAIVAMHYCCKAYWHHRKRDKKVEIGLAGLEDDFEICKRVYLYAYDCVKARCAELKSEHARLGWDARSIREACNSYGWGFCSGVRTSFEKQDQEHQEWGLVMVVPQAVHKATSHHTKPTTYGERKTDGWRKRYAMEGYVDGEKFDPTHRIANENAVVKPEIESKAERRE